MKIILIASFLLLMANAGVSQNLESISSKTTQKGKLYLYWGWNRGFYSKSNIKFSGENYDFTLQKVIAKDRQSHFSIDEYFNPINISIPQYNFRIGYFINDIWNISLGMDHMKYVMQANQTTKISGNIDTQNAYDGVYSSENIILSPDFLQFEHTDGLNYGNLELRRLDKITKLNKSIKINLVSGAGFGLLIPKTNTVLMNNERHDEFHLAGYGTSLVLGLNLSFYDKFFLQTELKEGFINMSDIRTTQFVVDKASQSFFFTQFNILFGFNLNLNKSKKTEKLTSKL